MAARARTAALLLLVPLLRALAAAEPLGPEEVTEPTEPGLNAPASTELGVCTVTCGIGIREVLLTRGCPGSETKCIVGVKECRGPVDCGWGRPISENSTSVMMTCIYIPPQNRFKYVWKILFPDKPPHILPSDSAVLEVRRDTYLITYQCETQENENIIASVKYTVNTTTELEKKHPKRKDQSRKSRADAILVFCVVTAVILTIGVIFAIIFIILHWAVVKTVLESKNGQGDKYGNLTSRSSLHIKPFLPSREPKCEQKSSPLGSGQGFIYLDQINGQKMSREEYRNKSRLKNVSFHSDSSS